MARSDKDDELQKRLDRLMKTARKPAGSQQDAEAEQAADTSGRSALGKMVDYARAAFSAAAMVIDYLGPVGTFLKWAGGKYKRAFMRAAYETEEPTIKLDAEGQPEYSLLGKAFKSVAGLNMTQRLSWDAFYKFNEPEFKRDIAGQMIFNKVDAGKFVALTAAFAMAATVVTPVAMEGMVMATTMRTETAYLYYPNSHNDGSYSVRGCLTQGECSVEDSVYYNVEPSIARHIYSYFNDGTRFLPRKLVGPISFDSDNQCEVTVYGAPFKWLYEQFDSYPELVDINCSRLGREGSTQTQTGGDVAPAAMEQAPIVEQQPAALTPG